jgi:hypothetical protein
LVEELFGAICLQKMRIVFDDTGARKKAACNGLATNSDVKFSGYASFTAWNGPVASKIHSELVNTRLVIRFTSRCGSHEVQQKPQSVEAAT